MGFFGGFLIGRETATRESNSSGGGLLSSLIVIGLIIGFYNWVERTSVELFGDKLIQLFITYVLMSILIYRYNTEKRSLSIDAICLLLLFVNIFLCIILGFVFFDKIGFTPFSFLIEHLNILNWGTHNSFSEITGEIIWLILFPLHILCKPLGFMIVQKCIIKFIKNNMKFAK